MKIHYNDSFASTVNPQKLALVRRVAQLSLIFNGFVHTDNKLPKQHPLGNVM